MLSLLILVLALGNAPPPTGPSIALELKLLPEPSPKPGGDPALKKLMVKALERGDAADIVKAIVTIRARGEVLVNPHRVSLVLLEPSSPAIHSRSSKVRVGGLCIDCGRSAVPDDGDEKPMRLHPGETITVRRTLYLKCYGLTAGEKFVLAAEFEDGGQWLQKPPPPEVTIAMRRVQSNSLVLTYRPSGRAW